MKVYQYNTIPKHYGSTQTMQDFEAVMGQKPYLMKEVVRATTDKKLTLVRIAEEFGGKLYSKGTQMDSESMRYEWFVSTGDRIRKVFITEDCTELEAGRGVSEFAIVMDSDYYFKGSIFEFENEQQALVTRKPEKLADRKFRYIVTPVSSNRDSFIASSVLLKGKATRYISKATISPEMHDFGGFLKEDFNLEKHTNYVTRFRVDSSISGDAAMFMPNVIDLGGGAVFKQTARETKMMADLMESVNMTGLFANGNIDETTMNVLNTTDDGRAIPIGQGIIPQMKAFANHIPYKSGSWNAKKMKDVVTEVVSRKENKTGNEIIVLCNFKLFTEAQEPLDAIAGARLTTQDYFFKKTDKDRYIVGADYAGYRFAGNTIIFMEDTSLSNRYPDRGFGVVFNLYAETASGKKPNVQEVTIKGMPGVVKSYRNGVGGQDGKTSGVVSSMIHASEISMFKYSSMVMNDPYGTMFIQETTY